MEAVQQQKKKYMWSCPKCNSRFFSEPVTLGVRNGQLVRIPPICDKCFKSCSCGQRQPYGEYCQVCGDPRKRVNLIRYEIDPEDPTFGITSTGSTSYPTTTGTVGGTTASVSQINVMNAQKITIAVAGTMSSIGANFAGTDAGNMRVALYASAGAKPSGSPLAESGSVAMSGSAGWQDIPLAYYFAAGDYWLAFQTDCVRALYYTVSGWTRSYKTPYTYGAFPSWPADSLEDAIGLNVRIIYVQIKGYAKLTKATLSGAAKSVTSMSFYSHATGNFYAGIYTDSSGPAVLKWTSGSIAAIDDDWKTVDIADGTPNTLTLAAGDYWLAYQWDSVNPGPSYTLGGANTGAYLAQSYGAFPDPMTGETLSTENWSLYVTYVAYVVAGIIRDGLTGTPIASATVWLFKTSDKSYQQVTTSDGSGNYSFTVSENSTAYFVRAFKDGSNVFGTTDDDLVGA